jgi:uncharacterized membrane protein
LALARNSTAIVTEEDAPIYRHVGYTLLYGLLVSIAVMLAGMAYGALRGKAASGHVLALDAVLPHLRDGDPSALLDLGILLLFATPLAAVLVALFEFVRIGDRTLGLITFVLVILLGVGFFVALH